MPQAVCKSVIDWAATGSMLQGIGTVAGVGAVILAAIIGANVWKRQKRAERRFELAERILTATYKGRSALAYVRGPMMWAAELSAAEKKLEEEPDWARHTPERQKRMITGQAIYNRINNTRDEQLALDQCLPMARALFNTELEGAIARLKHQFWIVQVDVESYVDGEDGRDPAFTRKLRLGMYDVKPREGEKNEVSDVIAEAVRLIETTCQPALRLEPITETPRHPG